MGTLAWMDLIEDVSPDPAGPEAVMVLKQDLTFSNLQPFQTFVRQRFKDGKSTLKLDFAAVKFIDSAGVGAMAALHKQAKNAGGMLVVLNANQTVRSILKIVGLDKLIRFEGTAAPTGSQPSLTRLAPPATPTPIKGTPIDARTAPPSMHGVASEMSEGEIDQEVDDAVSRLLLREISVDKGGGASSHVMPTALTIHLKENVTYRNAQMVSEGLASYLRKGVKTLRVDMSRVDFVDSAGVAALLKTSRAYSDEGGALVVLSPSMNLQRIMKIAKLDKIMTIEMGPE